MKPRAGASEALTVTPAVAARSAAVARAAAAALLAAACTIGDAADPPAGGADAASPAADAAGHAPDGGGGAPDATPLPLPAISFDAYHDQDEIADYLRAVAAARPGWVRFEVLGESREGREIAYVVIDATGVADAPAAFANGTHHGDEKSSTETALGVIDALLRGADADAIAVRDRFAVYVLPLVNPDGHAYDTREDSLGRDPNRDYAYPGRSEAQSFDLVEIQRVKSLQDMVGFRAALAYHSGITEVIWPWAYTGAPTPDAERFAAVAGAGCDAMGFDRCLQSYDDYPTEGEYIDYAYWKHGTIAVTVEVSEAKTPSTSQLAGVVDRGVRGTFAVLLAVAELDAGARRAPADAAPRYGRAGFDPWRGNRLE